MESSRKQKIIANGMKAHDSKSDIKENDSATSHEKIPIPARMYRFYLVDKILTKLDLSKDCHFLDVGCGTGEFVLKMAKLGYKGWGIDLGSHSVEVARKKVRNFEADIRYMDLMDVDRSFDLIFAFSVFEHIEDDVEAFAKVYEILNEDGYFIFSVPGNKNLLVAVDEAYGHFRRYNRDEIVKKLDQAGFEPIIIWSWGPHFLSKFYRFMARKEDNTDFTIDERTERSAYYVPASSFLIKFFLYIQSFFSYIKFKIFSSAAIS